MANPEKVLTEDLWRIIEPLLPEEKPLGTPRRPMVPNRKAMLGILYVPYKRMSMECFTKGVWLSLYMLEEVRDW